MSLNQIDAILKELAELEESAFIGTVGVVAPFRQQTNRIRDRAMEMFANQPPPHWKLHFDTADGFQGDERDVILLSLVGGPDMPQGALWFLGNSPNRFNVAVSRARAVLHVFGDLEWANSCGIKHIEQLTRAWEKSRKTQAPKVRTDLIGPVWEPKLAEALRLANIPFQQQYPVCGRYLDFALIREGLKLDVEVDGESTHRDAFGLRYIDDLDRDMVLVANGWTVKRFWVYQLREDMDGSVEQIRRLWEGHQNG